MASRVPVEACGPTSRAALREVRFEVEEFYYESAGVIERGEIIIRTRWRLGWPVQVSRVARNTVPPTNSVLLL